MVKRCHDPNEKSYLKYGALGIKVCDRWRYSFPAFFEDMGPKSTPAHSIDRRDSSGDYEPGNCRWATDPEQAVNRRLTQLNRFAYRGVGKKPGCNRWYAKATFEGKSIFISGLATPEEAAWMYDQMALAIHGEFAHLNFVYEPLPSSC